MRWLFFLLLFLPSTAVAGGAGDVWVCDQVGTIENVTWVFTSPFVSSEWVDPADFEDAVMNQTDDEFDPVFDAKCNAFESEAQANKYLKARVQEAHKRKLDTLHIKFP